MIKTVKRIIGLCAITSLLALSITSCQQPTTPNEQPKKTPEEVLEILNSAEKTLQLPNFPTTDNNIETIELPTTIKAENENVAVSWELTVNNPDYKLTDNKLSITRNLVAADCKLKATLKYDTKSVTKDFTKTIPAKLKYKWFDDPTSPEDSIEVTFTNNTFNIQNHTPMYYYSYKDINTQNKTLIAKITKYDLSGNIYNYTCKPEITYNYKLNEDNSISIWPASEPYKKNISITEWQDANDTSEETPEQIIANTLQLPNFPTTDNNIETIELPKTIKVENKNLTVSWEFTEDNPNYKLTDNKLTITRDLVAADCKLQARVNYNETKPITKKFTKTIPAKLRYVWIADTSDCSVSFDFVNNILSIQHSIGNYEHTFTNLNTKGKTFTAKIKHYDNGTEGFDFSNSENRKEINYAYEILENEFCIWQVDDTTKKSIVSQDYHNQLIEGLTPKSL